MSIIRRGGVCVSSVGLLYLQCFPQAPCLSPRDSKSHLVQLSYLSFSMAEIALSSPNHTQSNWLTNLRVSSCATGRWWLPERLEEVWPYDECVYGLECLLGCPDCVGIPHTKGGLSNKYCWGPRQTVVKISASFQRLALSSQLTLTVNQCTSQPTQTKAHPPKTQTSDYFQRCIVWLSFTRVN